MPSGGATDIEDIQDHVELALMRAGEHKVARGFLPAMTRSFHYIRDKRFRAAIHEALQREAEGLRDYRQEVLEHSPYVTNPPALQQP